MNDVPARSGIEVPSRLVREDDVRIAGERACDRDPLHLASRELGRPVLHPVDERHLLEEPLDPLPPLPRSRPPEEERHLDVLVSRDLREKVEVLKDEPYMTVPGLGEAIGREAGDFLAAEKIRALGRRVEAAEDVHERRLPGAGGTDDRDELVSSDREIDSAERLDVERSRPIDFTDPLKLDEGSVRSCRASVRVLLCEHPLVSSTRAAGLPPAARAPRGERGSSRREDRSFRE